MTAVALVSRFGTEHYCKFSTTNNNFGGRGFMALAKVFEHRRLREIFVTAYTTASEFGIDPTVVAGRLSEEHQRGEGRHDGYGWELVTGN
jgi:hypothetical protein